MYQKPMYVNDLLTTTNNMYFWNRDGITYTTAAVMCAALEITRRDAVFNADTQTLTFTKDGNQVTVSNEEIRLNGVQVIAIGFNPDTAIKTMPMNSIISAFGGIYEETADEILITYL